MTKHCTLKKSCYEDELCHYNKPCENQLLTNADRIRGMSDEELAEFLWEQNGSNRYWKSVGKYLDWLRQPAKEEHHEAD